MRNPVRRSKWKWFFALAVAVLPSLLSGWGVATAGEPPTPGSPRDRLLGTSTLDALHLAHSSGTVRVGPEYNAAQVATIARLYDWVSWVYSGTETTAVLHDADPDVIVTQYADLTWVGNYDLLPGLSWMPMDWGFVDRHENFFAHSSLAFPWSEKRRIPNPFFGWEGGSSFDPRFGGAPREWLANPFDIDEDNPGNLDRWVNYYTASVRNLIASDGMDGVSIDEAMQPYSLPPDDFDPVAWHEAIKRALAFLRAELGPDVVLLWNGLLQDALLWAPDSVLAGGRTQPRSLDYFEWADAAVLECFATCYLRPFPEVWPSGLWEMIEDLAMEVERRGGVLIAQSPVMRQETRLYALASFYLVKGQRSYYSGGGAFWLPEYEVSMGAPLVTKERVSEYLVLPGRDLGARAATGAVYARPYERGVALVNPSDVEAVALLERPGFNVQPQGGGSIAEDGSMPEGRIVYEETEAVLLAPHGGALVVWEVPDSPEHTESGG